jgi:hypothetical protein
MSSDPLETRSSAIRKALAAGEDQTKLEAGLTLALPVRFIML